MRVLFYILGYLSVSFLMAFWTDRNLDFWLTYVSGKTIDVPFWLSWVASLVGPISLGVNVLGELARLAV